MQSNSPTSEKENKRKRSKREAEDTDGDVSMSDGDDGRRKISKGKQRAVTVEEGEEEEEEEEGEEGDGDGDGDSDEEEREYDPKQDKEEKRKIRKAYRSKLEEIEEIRGALAETGVDDLTNLVREADALFKKVKAPQEATLDSRLLALAADLGNSKIRSLKVDSSEFDVGDYINKLRAYMGGRRVGAGEEDEDEDEVVEGRKTILDWKKVGMIALRHSKVVTGSDFMNGPLSIVKTKKTIIRQQRAKPNEQERSRPQELTKEDIEQSTNRTDKLVVQIHDILDNLGPNGTEFIPFIFNPESFSQTVENLFYFSFLIKDGKACLEETDDGEWIAYCTDPADAEEKAQGVQKLQLVLELTQEIWEDALKNFNLKGKRPIIPTRKSEVAPTGGKWYG